MHTRYKNGLQIMTENNTTDLETDEVPQRRNGYDETGVTFHERHNLYRNQTRETPTGNINYAVVIGGRAQPTQRGSNSEVPSPHRPTNESAHLNIADVPNYAPEKVRVNDTGVSFDRPKYIQYAIRLTRHKTFKNWPRNHFLSADELEDSGFFYSENGDTVVCYYCGLALNAWEDGDRPWTEHARWSPNCTHILNMMGPTFIKETIECDGNTRKLQDVDNKYKQKKGHGGDLQADCPPVTPAKTPQFYEDMMQRSSVQSVKEMNIEEMKIRDAIRILINRKKCEEFTAVELMEVVFDIDDCNLSNEDDYVLQGNVQETVRNEIPKKLSRDHTSKCDILKENDTLRDQLTCKVCLEAAVSVVFLPCGHLSCCAECAPALKNCPICRANIKGSVRTYLT